MNEGDDAYARSNDTVRMQRRRRRRRAVMRVDRLVAQDEHARRVE